MYNVLICWSKEMETGRELNFYELLDVGPNYFRNLESLNGLFVGSKTNDIIRDQIIKLQSKISTMEPLYSDTQPSDGSLDITKYHKLIVTGE